MKLSHDARGVLVGTAVMALVSTVADAFWAAALPEHRAVYGLVHGGLVLGALGVVLAWQVGGRGLARWALASVLVGVFAAVVFYGLFPFVGVAAIVIAWMGMWLAFAQIAELAAAVREGRARSLFRGVLAAVLSGVGFWAISGIWIGPHDPGPLYWRNLVAWCIAFAPGFVALFGGRTRKAG